MINVWSKDVATVRNTNNFLLSIYHLWTFPGQLINTTEPGTTYFNTVLPDFTNISTAKFLWTETDRLLITRSCLLVLAMKNQCESVCDCILKGFMLFILPCESMNGTFKLATTALSQVPPQSTLTITVSYNFSEKQFVAHHVCILRRIFKMQRKNDF
jgi:hypothetical protein